MRTISPPPRSGRAEDGGCSATRDGVVAAASAHEHQEQLVVADVAGFTKIGFSEDYLVVVNVLPGEPMYSRREYHEHRPTFGELILGGTATPLETNSRHVEAHVYDRSTGRPIVSPVPIIELTDNTSGQVHTIGSVLMHDVIVGENDIHFGDNAVLSNDTDLTVKVTIGEQEVVVDGYLG